MSEWVKGLLAGGVALSLLACGGGRDGEPRQPDNECNDASSCTSGETPDSLDSELLQAAVDALVRGCDPLDPNYCLYPFPNNHFTVADSATDTGLRINLQQAAMPRNATGRPIDPTEWNRNDGFSPGALIEARLPGLSLDDAVYGDTLVIPHLWRIQNSLDSRSAIVIIDATPTLPVTQQANPFFGKPHLAWAELDANGTKFGVCDSTSPAATAADLAGIGELEDVVLQIAEFCAAAAVVDPAGENDVVNDPGPALLIHPGVNLEEGHRYIVALRGLRDANGELLTPSPAFQVYRDQIPSALPNIEARRPHMEEIFGLLANSSLGIARQDLTLAWDFTVISERNMAERVLHMRNEAFANYLPTVGGTPEFTVDAIEDFLLTGDDCLGSAQDDNDPGRGDRNVDNCIARRVTGTVTVPSYMTIPRTDNPLTDIFNEQAPVPLTQYVGGRLNYDPLDSDELPDVNPTSPTESFVYSCNIPRSAFAGALDPALATTVVPSRGSLYGHGLLGSQSEGRGQAQLKRFANEHNFMFCMTDWIGMSHYDIANVASVLMDMSNFPTLADRAQQGFLNKMFLARLIQDPAGFASDPAFQVNGQPLFRTGEVYYDGNSQGGIMGGALVALSPDLQRGSLGVVGMNYSTLLSRSVDFAPYGAIYYSAYPESLDQQFVFSLIQMLWDRAENNGYAQHLGDGQLMDSRIGLANRALPGLPEGSYDVALGPFNPAIGRMPQKDILLHPAFGDHQVTHWSAEVMARTIGVNGADVNFRGLDATASSNGEVVHTYGSRADWLAQRDPDEQSFFGMGDLDYSDATQIGGSAFVIWDEGKTAVPPLDNTFNTIDDFDPHEYPRRTVAARCQKARFLRADGRVVDVNGLNNANTVACPATDGSGAAFAP